MNKKVSKKGQDLFILAVVMLISGGVIIVVGFNDFLIRSGGVLMCVVSAYLVRVSNGRNLNELSSADNQKIYPAMARSPGRLAWIFGVTSVVAFGIFLIYLYKDALDGYNQIWPVYTFAASGLICALVWGYIVAKLMQRT